jgi:glucose-6-phosphate isomerase
VPGRSGFGAFRRRLAGLERQHLSPERIAEITPQKVHYGCQPNTVLLFEMLDPTMLGRLIALYQHEVLTQGVVWAINSFDQWGVELGKKPAGQLVPAVKNPPAAHSIPAGVLKLLQRIDQLRSAG